MDTTCLIINLSTVVSTIIIQLKVLKKLINKTLSDDLYGQ